MARPVMHPVPEGKTRICVAGYKISPYTGRSRYMAAEIAKAFPSEYETWFYFDDSDKYFAFLKEKFDPVPFPAHLKGHQSSPFVWLEKGSKNDITPLGGNDYFSKWVLGIPTLAANKKIHELATSWTGPSDLFHNSGETPQSTANIAP